MGSFLKDMKKAVDKGKKVKKSLFSEMRLKWP